MEIDDFVKANPPKPQPQQTYIPKQSKQTQQPTSQYTCMICHNNFDKPVVRYMCRFYLELLLFLMLMFICLMFYIFGYLSVPLLKILSIKIFAWSFVISIVFSVIRRCSRKEICPYCKSENFIKHW